MKQSAKRILSFVLCLAMLVGMFPAFAIGANAADTVLDAAIFCSDVHGSTSDLTSVMAGVKTSGVTYSSIGFVGDTALTVANTESAVNSGLGYTPKVMFSYAASHDTENSADISTNWNYSGEVADVSDYYLVYTIRETDMQNNTTAEADFTTWYSGLTDAQKQLPIFIMSHRPLHARRNDNANAADWYEVISAAAATSDIVFFWAHNHTDEDSVDTAAYYVEKNGSETISVYNGDTEVPNFTYMNAGYINANNQSPKRINVATTVQITADSLIFQDYTTSGAYTNSSYAHNVTVARDAVSTDSGDSGDSEDSGSTDSGEDGTTEGVTDGATTDYGTYNEVTLNGSVTTTETKTVYVLTSSISSGNSYLIANSATAGSANLVANDGGDLSNTSATVVYGDCDGDGDSEYYIELDDATNELWTTSGSSSTTLTNDGYYLRYNEGLGLSTRNSTEWSYSNNRLSCSVRSGRNTYTYYLGYDSEWTASTTQSNVYFYIPTEIEVDVTVDSTVKYTMRASDLKQVVTEDNKTASLDFCLQGNGTDLTTLPSGGSYSFTVLSDDNSIISSIGTDGTVTFSGTYGEATVKVAYTWNQDGQTYTVYKNITIEATEPYYSLDLHSAVYTFTEADVSGGFDSTKSYYVKNSDGSYTLTTDTAPVDGTTYYTVSVTAGEEITTTVAIKGVEKGDTYSTWAVIKYFDGTTADGEDLGDVDDTDIKWTSSDESIATVDPSTGIVTFTGKEGTVNITAAYLEGNQPLDTITLSVSATQYSVPADGTNDFPEYPNEGAIRYDKTATAVGNFSETGIAQVELSMTGVPYTTGSEIDVVVMLDMTGSMSENGIAAAESAAKAFVETIVKNADGTYNSNRVAVYQFNSDGVSTYFDLMTISSDSELETAQGKISGTQVSGGTPFEEATSHCYNVLKAAKTDGTGNNRQQFCVFMSDGGPTTYYGSDEKTYYGGNNNSGDVTIVSMMTNYTSSTASSWSMDLPTEYYTDQMKADGVTVYTVGLLLQNTPSNPEPWSKMTSVSSVYDSDTDSLTTVGTHYYFTSEILKQMASDESKYIDIFTVDNADNAVAKFENIAVSILQAATDITVEDKITDEYTMIFDVPTGSVTIDGEGSDLEDQEFYIEFVKFDLDENHERTTETSITKLYLKNTNGVYSAASDASGTAYAAPVFEQTTIGDKGTLYYWTTNATMAGKAAVSYNDGTTTYYFIPYGQEANEDGTAPDGWYNMTSGGYAKGTVDSTTNMSTDLVIATPYFVYNAATKMLYWTVDKLDTTEYALRYFLYLDDSATEVGTSKEVPADTYPTNHHAYITYTNFNGNDCRQEFPIPQLTWNGAQVSYVFYLVNAAGQPINKSGQVVDFANATFITQVYTKAVVWNKSADGSTGTGELSADWLADELLPDEYTIYDELAGYELNVYENADGTTIKNQFTIQGDTKANISASLNERLKLSTTESTVSDTTTKVYNTKAGEKITGYGTYYSTDADMAGFDFANTTVAFAVVWQASLTPDTVVVDYGLDTVINVVENDMLQNTVSGIGLGAEAYGNIAMNSGISTTPVLTSTSLTLGDGNTIAIAGENGIRFTQSDMIFTESVTFYYESPVSFQENSEAKNGYMYSSVTVIPATTIYYEDNFVSLTAETWDYTTNAWTSSTGADNGHQWTTAGSTESAVQDTDRPGDKLIADDANNLYGYDSAYTEMSQYSMGSAAKINVDYDNRGLATFEFYGTGFDVISMTSNTTGTIMVSVYPWDSTTGAYGDAVINTAVDSYYGYVYKDGEWVITDSNDPNALYQVPVMKATGLTYGKYKAVIAVTYDTIFDHEQYGTTECYDFYLDAIRIYDPANNGASDEKVKDAYVADGEYMPAYYELRDWLITADTFQSITSESGVNGIVFIDGNVLLQDSNAVTGDAVKDYTNYGPNNELYLAPGQAVAFDLNASAGAPTGYEVDQIQIAIKSVGGTAYAKIWDAAANDETGINAKEVATATDMYYSISTLEDKTVVIKNSGADTDAILSITNVKVTYKVAETTSDGTATASVEEEYGIAVASEETTEEPAVFTVSAASADAAVMSMRRATVEDSTEETTEETTEEITEEITEETTEEPTEEITEETTEEVTEETTEETTEEDTGDGSSDAGGIIGWLIGLIGKIFG